MSTPSTAKFTMPSPISCFLPRHRHAIAMLASAMVLAVPAAAQPQHAHRHGQLSLDIAVDAQSITLSITSPLDGFLGFERAPRSDVERRRVAELVTQMNAADQLFQPDPVAGCKLSKVTLDSAVLRLGTTAEKPHRHDHSTPHGHSHGHDSGHADIDIDVAFACDKATEARFIDVKLFEAYPRIRSIDVQLASPQGQSGHSLRPGNARLHLAR